MKKLIYLASLLCVLHISASQSPIASSSKSPIPKEFTVLYSKTLAEKDSLTQQEKTDCFFYILVSAPTPTTVNTKTKEKPKNPENKNELYKIFANITKEQHGPLIPQDFIKPGIPKANTPPTYVLHYGWTDTGSKIKLINEAKAFNKSLERLHLKNKKSHTCYYLIVTEGRSGLLVNYATHQPLHDFTLSLSVVIEIGTPLPASAEKASNDFYPNLSKASTFYSFYTEHSYLSNPAYFPPSPRTSYPQTFIDKHTNLYNVRLLLNNNQRSLQNIFEGQTLKQPLAYLGQHIFEYCNIIKRSYTYHRDLSATLDTRTESTPIISIISHPAGEKASKIVKKEHQLAGKQLDIFKKKIGSSPDTRINMSERAKMQSTIRPIAQLKKLQKLTCQTA